MLPAEVENYFSEIRRVLKEDGKCLISYFLLNRTSEKLIDDGSSTLNFKQEFNGYRSIPGHAIAYQEAFIRDLYERYTFEILEPIYFGSWCGREPFLSYQDIVIGRKRSEEPSGRAGI
jgi:ubiquinone/menaquinone biosynthesis C-methylase UbiE